MILRQVSISLRSDSAVGMNSGSFAHSVARLRFGLGGSGFGAGGGGDGGSGLRSLGDIAGSTDWMSEMRSLPQAVSPLRVSLSSAATTASLWSRTARMADRRRRLEALPRTRLWVAVTAVRSRS